MLAAIDRRIANASMTPVRHGEGLQVLRYEAGQKYDAHYDYVSYGVIFHRASCV